MKKLLKVPNFKYRILDKANDGANCLNSTTQEPKAGGFL